MTTEAHIPIPYQQLLESLLQGAGSNDKTMALLQSILGGTELAPQEEMILKFLSSLQDNEDNNDAQIIDGESVDIEYGYEESLDGRRASNRSRFERLRAELADLREVNDTLAAALGACQYCWGGDEECAMCEGQGSAGWRMPHARLFEELVVPAIHRVRALKLESRRQPRRSWETRIRR